MKDDEIFGNEKNPFDEYDHHLQENPIDSATPATSKPLIAGILLIIAGALGLLTWISALSVDLSMIDPSLFQADNVSISPAQLESFVQICATIGIVLSVFPILGGILSVQKKLWGGALSCSIISLFIVGPVFLSSILGLIALILIYISKDEFKK